MSAGSVMLRQRYTDLFFSRLPFIDEILFENFDAPSLTYNQVFNVRDSNRAAEETTGISGFGLFPTKTESAAITYDTLQQLYDKRFTHVTYAKGFQISMEAMDDDLDGAITDATPALARAARNSIETVIWDIFNNGFTSETSPDGAYIFASHSLVGGSTYDNSAAADLSVATLESGINKFDTLVDERSLLIETSPDKIVIPVQLRWLAHEILRSELRSDTTDNSVNAFNQIGLDIVMTKYLTDSDAWFLSVPNTQHRILVYWRMEPVTDHTLDFDTGNMKTKMTYRLSQGAADWRGVYGSAGA
mgnify:CR=1 FL=1